MAVQMRADAQIESVAAEHDHVSFPQSSGTRRPSVYAAMRNTSARSLPQR